jgi:hypothetical protein
MTYNVPIGALRLLTGLGLLFAVAWQVTDRIANDIFRPTEYFAYFSIVTAILAGLVLVTTGVGLWLNLEDEKWVEIGRLSMAVAMTVVGVVYHLLLADVAADIRDGGYKWPVLPNEIIHTYAPILIVLDYLLSLRSHPIKLKAALWVVVFPLAWLSFSVVRGSLTGWWPYWFLNPTEDGGVAGMLSYVAGIAGFFLLLGFLALGLKKGMRALVLR